jgi:hypothetical protein
LTADVFWKASLLSAPSIWKLLPRVRMPLTELSVVTPGASWSMRRKSRPLSGRSCTCFGWTTLARAVDWKSRPPAVPCTCTVSVSCETPSCSEIAVTRDTVTSTVAFFGWNPSSFASTM